MTVLTTDKDVAVNKDIKKRKHTDNPGHNILTFLDVLAIFLFTKREAMRDYW